VRLILLAALLLSGCGQAASQANPGEAAHFAAQARAIDGDTVAVSFRLLGVDAFEKRQMCMRADTCWPCGKAAQDYAAKALDDETAEIHLTSGHTYGRPVATVTVSGGDLGEKMIRAGLAIPADRYLADDPSRAARYQRAFAEAGQQHVGAHAGTWLDPAKWRHGARLACETGASRRWSDRDTRTDPA
jgi:micrococcal nuclease